MPCFLGQTSTACLTTISGAYGYAKAISLFIFNTLQIEQGRKPRLFRFERSGAIALAGYDSGVQISPVTLGATHPPSTQLLQHHFRIALLLHVRGFGVRPRAGATMI